MLVAFVSKCFRYAFDSTMKRMRLIKIRAMNPGIDVAGSLSLQEGVRFRKDENAILRLRGPMWLHRNVALHAEGKGHLSMDENTAIGPYTIIAAMEDVTIGKNCLFAESVSIRDHDHRYDLSDIPIREQGWVVKPIRIGDNVWLGCKVTVMKGVTIGDNVIVGANSVVTHDIPSNSLAVGAPARVIRTIGQEEFKNSSKECLHV